jgi:hypothetical protein
MTISREEAICILYCEKYTEANVETLSKRINEMIDIEICYNNDPYEPMLQCIKRIYGSPNVYHLYLSNKSLQESIPKEDTENSCLGKQF